LSSRNPYTPYANEELIKEINNATNQFRARVIPKITEHVDTANPLASVVNNITNIKSEYAATSPYTFFSIAAAGIIIAAGVAAAQLKN